MPREYWYTTVHQAMSTLESADSKQRTVAIVCKGHKLNKVIMPRGLLSTAHTNTNTIVYSDYPDIHVETASFIYVVLYVTDISLEQD